MRGLVGLFGAASIPDLEKRILDAGSPILLKPTVVSNRFHIADNGTIAMGDVWDWRKAKPVTWAQYFVDCGAKTRKEIADHAYGWDLDDVDELIDEENWPGIFDMHYEPMAAGYHFLKRERIGTRLQNRYKTAGRLDFFAGSNHPGSCDLWVECWDNLTVSLLQADLIRKGHSIEIIMEQGGVWKDDPDAYGDDRADE